MDGTSAWQHEPLRPAPFPSVRVKRLSFSRPLVRLFTRCQTDIIPSLYGSALTDGVVDTPWVYGSWVRISPATSSIKRSRLPLSVIPRNRTAWIFTRPPLYSADLLSRRFRGKEYYKASIGQAIGYPFPLVKHTNILYSLFA